MKYKLGDIVEARGGLGFSDPGPWVILVGSKIMTAKEGENDSYVESNNHLYFGRYLSNGEQCRGSFENQIVKATGLTKEQQAAAKLIMMVYG